jgi:hypothetical protein
MYKSLFEKFLQSSETVYNYVEKFGVFTVFTIDKQFKNEFNRWNEENGIVYSMVILPNFVYVIYTANNGVQITDLTR